MNPATGEYESVGLLANRRQVGPYNPRLTYDEERQLWWIIVLVDGGKTATSGYTEERRKIAWELFTHGTESEIVNNLLSN